MDLGLGSGGRRVGLGEDSLNISATSKRVNKSSYLFDEYSGILFYKRIRRQGL